MPAIPAIDDAPEPAPVPARDARWELAEEYLHGSGIEIGALHLAMRLPDDAAVRYVDRMTVPDLRAHYPELATLELAHVDVVDDGERLTTIPDGSVDFIVANHFLEHTEDPIATIETHLTRLTPGGVLFYAVPDKRYTFDFRRDRTPLAHHIDDHERGPEGSRGQHYLEWASHVHEGTGPPSPEQAQAYAHQLEAEGYSIHFHVWTHRDLLTLMLHIQQRAGGFEIEAVRRHGIENIVVLRRAGDFEPRLPRADDDRPLQLPGPVGRPPSARADARVALAGLRGGPPGADGMHWSIDPDGLVGRALVQDAGATYRVPLRSAAPVPLTGTVRLLPHDWRDGRGAVAVAVSAIGADGQTRELWTASLRSAEQGGDRDGAPIACEVPAGTTEIRLAAARPTSRAPGSVACVAWVEPLLGDVPGGDRPAEPAVPAGPARSSAQGSGAPLVSILTPVHDPAPHMLAEAIESVRAQTLDDWELCLTDDGSRDPEVVAMLERYAATDARIKLVRHERAGGISAATNAALEMATGEFVALLDHDDLLVPDALEIVAGELGRDPTIDMVYSDEAVVADGRKTAQVTKPGWSPEGLRCLMYTCHLGVYRRSIARDVGGFRSQFDGCQDYDFVLRFSERTDRIVHIPAQLYHWRAHSASTAGGGQAKPYAYLLQPRAIADHLKRLGVEAEVEFGSVPGVHRIVHRVRPEAEVSIVVRGTDEDGLRGLVASLHGQSHRAWTLTVAAPGRDHPSIEALLATLAVDATLVDVDGDQASALAAGATAAHAEHLLLMAYPAVALTDTWLTALLGYGSQTGIGAAGPLVVDGDGRVAEAGYAFPAGVALALSYGASMSAAPAVATNVSALGGVVLTGRDALVRAGGLDPTFGSLMLAEYCVRVGETGQRVVLVPDSRLQSPDAGQTPNDLDALARLRQRWTGAHDGDPLYNAGYRTDRGDVTPRVRL